MIFYQNWINSLVNVYYKYKNIFFYDLYIFRKIDSTQFMETENVNSGNQPVKKKKKIFLIIGIIILLAVYLLYSNFNRLLSDALMKSFNSSRISDIYELKFEKLNVNLFLGNIRVSNVELLPRIKPLRNYPYINTSFELKTNRN